MQSQPRMLQALSCQALRASRDGVCPASLASLCALAFPPIQLECLLDQGNPCFSQAALRSLALSLGYPPPRLGLAAMGAPGHVHHPGSTSPAPSGVCSDHPGGLCLLLPQSVGVWLEFGGSKVEVVLCCRLWSEQRGIISSLSHPAVLLLVQPRAYLTARAHCSVLD